MKKSHYTEEQIAFALHQAEQGTPVAEVTRKMGISEQTFYRYTAVWARASYADSSSLKRKTAS
jgi:putative transposase